MAITDLEPWTLLAEFLLFDLDGTLVDSAGAISTAWNHWASDKGISAPDLRRALGGTSRSTIRQLVAEDVIEQELARLRRYELLTVKDVRPILGARKFLDSVPRDRWAIVTSSTADVALARLSAAGLPTPPLMIAADDYVHSKPEPTPYTAALSRINRTPSKCLSFEDSLNGIASANAAGLLVVGVATYDRPHTATRYWIHDFSEISVRSVGGGLILCTKGSPS